MQYLGQHTQIPLLPSDTPTREDELFAELHTTLTKPKAQEVKGNTWISENTWMIVDTRVSMCWYPTGDQKFLRRLGTHIKVRLQVDRQHQEEMDRE